MERSSRLASFAWERRPEAKSRSDVRGRSQSSPFWPIVTGGKGSPRANCRGAGLPGGGGGGSREEARSPAPAAAVFFAALPLGPPSPPPPDPSQRIPLGDRRRIPRRRLLGSRFGQVRLHPRHALHAFAWGGSASASPAGSCSLPSLEGCKAGRVPLSRPRLPEGLREGALGQLLPESFFLVLPIQRGFFPKKCNNWTFGGAPPFSKRFTSHLSGESFGVPIRTRINKRIRMNKNEIQAAGRKEEIFIPQSQTGCLLGKAAEKWGAVAEFL